MGSKRLFAHQFLGEAWVKSSFDFGRLDSWGRLWYSGINGVMQPGPQTPRLKDHENEMLINVFEEENHG